jgi:hypothetical protein
MKQLRLFGLLATLILIACVSLAPRRAEAASMCPQNIFGTQDVTPTAGEWWLCIGYLQNSVQGTNPLASLPNADIFVGNAFGVPAQVSVSGDAALSNTGALTVTKTAGVPFGTAATENIGKSVSNPGTGALEALLPIKTNTYGGYPGTACTTSCVFTGADLQYETRRSNSGTAMTDTFPASSITGMANGTKITLNNADSTATDTLTAGSGTTFTVGGSTTSTYAQSAGRSIAWVYDAPNTTWRPTFNTATSALLGQSNAFTGQDTFTGSFNVAPNPLASGAPSSITGTNVGGTTYPEAYGASHSTSSLSGCTTASSSNQLSCSAIGDFTLGEGVRVPGAGPVSPLSGTVAAPTLTVNGTTGSTTIEYEVCRADPWGGISGCNMATVTNANAILSLANSVTVAFTPQGVNAELTLVYRKIGAGSWQFLTVATGSPYYDIGWNPPCASSATNCGWPATPGTQNQDLFSYITAINAGTNTFTLNDNASVALSGTAAVYHDDTLAVQSALSNCSGGVVQLGPYNYNIDRPSVWNYTTKQFYNYFTASTPNYPSLYGEGKLQIPSNCTVAGAGKGVTAINSLRMTNPSGQDHTFGLGTGQHNGVFNWSPTPTNCAISNANVGQASVTTTTAACAGNFSVGDYIVAAGGASLCGGCGYYSTEISRVVSANASTGTIQLADALEKPNPFGTAGLSPTAYLVTSEMMHDITVRDMTVNNLSGWLTNISPVYKINLYNIAAQQMGNTSGALVWASTIRHLICDNCDLVGRQEADQDEDWLVKNGTWFNHQGTITISEGSSNIVFDHELITITDWSCSPTGITCSTSSGMYGFTAQNQASTLFQVLNSSINCQQSLSNATETNSGVPCLGSFGGLISGTLPYGLSIINNSVTSNGRTLVEEQYPVVGSVINGNNLASSTAAENPVTVVAITGGTLNNNTITVSPPSASGDGYDVIKIAPQTTNSQPFTLIGNNINVTNGPTHNGIEVTDPGASFTQLITLGNNSIVGASTAIVVDNPSNTTNVQFTTTLGSQTETKNTVYAGPSSGSAAAPTFRALATADLPAVGGFTTGGYFGASSQISGSTLSMGTASASGSTSPLVLDLGGTFSSVAGAHPKFNIYDDGTSVYGFGVSSGNLDYMAPSSSTHTFYEGGTAVGGFTGSGTFRVSGGHTNSVVLSGSNTNPSANTTGGNFSIGSAGGTTILTDAAVTLPGISTSTSTLDYLCWNASGGAVTADGAGTCLASLEELKDNYGYMVPNEALAEVLKLKPFWGKYKDSVTSVSDHREHAMFGAHQVESVDPRLASYDGDGNLHGVRYMEMSALQAAAIQALEAKINAQARQIEELQKLIGKSASHAEEH